jgi:hypothetical protein
MIQTQLSQYQCMNAVVVDQIYQPSSSVQQQQQQNRDAEFYQLQQQNEMYMQHIQLQQQQLQQFQQQQQQQQLQQLQQQQQQQQQQLPVAMPALHISSDIQQTQYQNGYGTQNADELMAIALSNNTLPSVETFGATNMAPSKMLCDDTNQMVFF